MKYNKMKTLMNNLPKSWHTNFTLRKHAYLNILKILQTKKREDFQIKKSDIFHISAQNINCGYWLELPGRGSNKYPQYMFLSKNKNNNVYPYKPQFYNIKVEFKGSKLYRHVFVMSIHLLQTVHVYDSFTYSQQ